MGKNIFTVKVYNTETKREDVHTNISSWELGYLKSGPNLKVEVLEVKTEEDEENKQELAN